LIFSNASLRLLWDGKPYFVAVLMDADAFIGQVEENHSGSYNAAGLNDICVDDIAYAHQHKDENLFENP
jgi:hypothetical protein